MKHALRFAECHGGGGGVLAPGPGSAGAGAGGVKWLSSSIVRS